LPASNTAAVLACLDILEREPERVVRLQEITRRVRSGYREIGLFARDSDTPIIPIHVGSEDKAFNFAQDLFHHGIFALPAVFPAVPRGQALIRTAYMSTHQDHQIDTVLDVMDRLVRKHRIRTEDLESSEQYASTA
jgi:glycine C-acetyltransferase